MLPLAFDAKTSTITVRKSAKELSMHERFFARPTLGTDDTQLLHELEEVYQGVAYPADGRLPPAKNDCIPRSDADLSKPSILSYEDIDRLITQGLVEEPDVYRGYINLRITYTGRKEQLRLQGFKHHEWITWERGKGWRNGSYICCSKALPMFCVCMLRTKCEDHGDRCHGSHD